MGLLRRKTVPDRGKSRRKHTEHIQGLARRLMIVPDRGKSRRKHIEHIQGLARRLMDTEGLCLDY